MARRIFMGLLLVVVLGIAYLGYRGWSTKRAMNNGEIVAEVGDQQPAVTTVANNTPSTPRPVLPPQPAATPIHTLRPTTPPTKDSLSPNPANGARFSGSGRFQVYRQGDLTFRIDTRTGDTCVLFATNDQWSDPEIYNRGCRFEASH